MQTVFIGKPVETNQAGNIRQRRGMGLVERYEALQVGL
jgi:hypothetical protein